MWKLAEPDLRDHFTEEARNIIQQRGGEETQDWETMTEDLRQLGNTLLGKTSGNMTQGKEPGGGTRMFRKASKQRNWPR